MEVRLDNNNASVKARDDSNENIELQTYENLKYAPAR